MTAAVPGNVAWIEALGLALFHKKRPQAPYMAMTAYLDESGTHENGSKTVVVGGFLGSEYAWLLFERGLAALLKHHGIEYFHTKIFKKNIWPDH
jgi:hypothetical protein